MKLDNRVKELIAVGASITANCQPCLEYHVRTALKNGAGEDEIAEAIEVGKLVKNGAAAKMDKFIDGLDLAALAGSSAQDCECGCTE